MVAWRIKADAPTLGVFKYKAASNANVPNAVAEPTVKGADGAVTVNVQAPLEPPVEVTTNEPLYEDGVTELTITFCPTETGFPAAELLVV